MLCAGDTLPADLEDRAYLLSDPNINQFAAQMMEDPARLKKYITENCMDETIVKPRAYEYIYWVESDDREKLDGDLTMTQCVDNFGAWDQFARYVPNACQCTRAGPWRCITLASLWHFTLTLSDSIFNGVVPAILTGAYARHRWPDSAHGTATAMRIRILLHFKVLDPDRWVGLGDCFDTRSTTTFSASGCAC